MFNDLDQLLEQIEQFKRNITSSEHLIETLKQVTQHFEQETNTVRKLVELLQIETVERTDTFNKLMQYIEESQTTAFSNNLALVEQNLTTHLEMYKKELQAAEKFIHQEVNLLNEQQSLNKDEIVQQLHLKINEQGEQFQQYVNQLLEQLQAKIKYSADQLQTILLTMSNELRTHVGELNRTIVDKIEQTTTKIETKSESLVDLLNTQQHEIDELKLLTSTVKTDALSQLKVMQQHLDGRFEKITAQLKNLENSLENQLKRNIQLAENAVSAKIESHSQVLEYSQHQAIGNMQAQFTQQIDTLQKELYKKNIILLGLGTATFVTAIIAIFS